MAHRRKKRGKWLKKPGLAPGTLIHVGEDRTHQIRLHLIAYDPVSLVEEPMTLDSACALRGKHPVTWLDLDGIHDIPLIEELGQRFNLHFLILEDLLNTRQRPKVEDYGDHLFVVLRMLSYSEEARSLESEQVGLVIGNDYVISLQEKPGDAFEPVRARIRSSHGRIRSRGPDYLAYALMDAVVDHYFHVLEKLADQIEDLEREVTEAGTSESLMTIHSMKRDMILLRRSIWPLRELVGILLRTESPLIREETDVFLRDVYDHTIQIMDTVESLRDTLSGLLDLSFSITSNRMNEVMKVLTVIATIFIPLTFVAGIYGMNFENMPELGIPWAYPALLAILGVVALTMVFLFKRKGWL